MPTLVATHNGTFHADEVTAYGILRFCTPTQLIRTRNKSKIVEADIVIDVGGVYAPNKGRFDHHQKDCCESILQKSQQMQSLTAPTL